MKHIPMRMCVACREMHPQNELIRIVRDNSRGEITLYEVNWQRKNADLNALFNVRLTVNYIIRRRI